MEGAGVLQKRVQCHSFLDKVAVNFMDYVLYRSAVRNVRSYERDILTPSAHIHFTGLQHGHL